MADLTSEWCAAMADLHDEGTTPGGNYAKIAQALRIAARVLDEGAVERLARAICAAGRHNPDAVLDSGDRAWTLWQKEAQAVISYLLEGKTDGS